MKTYSYDTRKGVYTEWEVTISYKDLDTNRQWKIYNYQYVRRSNEALAPDSQIDNRALNRLRSFVTQEIEFTNINTFRFGKYCGKNIEQVFDIKYTCWYFEHIDGEHKQFVKDFLYNHYCEIRVNFNGNEYAVTPEILKQENAKKEKKEIIIKNANEGKLVYLNIKSNPNENGEIVIDDVVYIFPKVVERYYQGYSYFIPVKNGQAKRIKNKTIIANLFPVGDKIYISNFSIYK